MELKTTFNQTTLRLIRRELTRRFWGTEQANISYTPQLVAGKFGQALYFNGVAYAYVPPSPSLNTPSDITIDAWVKVSQFKDVAYNNIVIEAVSTTSQYPTRTLGFAINGVAPTNSSSPVLGVLRGYVTTDHWRLQ